LLRKGGVVERGGGDVELGSISVNVDTDTVFWDDVTKGQHIDEKWERAEDRSLVDTSRNNGAGTGREVIASGFSLRLERQEWNLVRTHSNTHTGGGTNLKNHTRRIGWFIHTETCDPYFSLQTDWSEWNHVRAMALSKVLWEMGMCHWPC